MGCGERRTIGELCHGGVRPRQQQAIASCSSTPKPNHLVAAVLPSFSSTSSHALRHVPPQAQRILQRGCWRVRWLPPCPALRQASCRRQAPSGAADAGSWEGSTLMQYRVAPSEGGERSLWISPGGPQPWPQPGQGAKEETSQGPSSQERDALSVGSPQEAVGASRKGCSRAGGVPVSRCVAMHNGLQ